MIVNLNQIKNLSEVVEMIWDHILDDEDGICSSDEERVEWMEDLLDEFFQIEVSEEVRFELLSLSRKSIVVRIDRKPYLTFTVIPNYQYEIITDEHSYYYWGSLEDLDSINQLEEVIL